MRPKLGASATLAPLALAAAAGLAGCGGPAPGPHRAASCAAATAAHVTVVVEPTRRVVLTRCVAIPSGGLGAVAVMRRSGVEMALQHYSFGDAVCQVDRVPAAYSQCLASGQPYWALFVAPAHGRFAPAATGISGIHVKAGEVLGWHYVPARGPATAPPLPRGR